MQAERKSQSKTRLQLMRNCIRRRYITRNAQLRVEVALGFRSVRRTPLLLKLFTRHELVHLNVYFFQSLIAKIRNNARSALHSSRWPTAAERRN